MLDWVKRNPVRVRTALTAVVIFVGWFVPGVTGVEEVIVHGVMAVLAVLLGWDASTRVVLPGGVQGDDAEADEASAYFRELRTDGGKHRRE